MLTSLEPWNVYDEHNDDSIFLATQVRTNVERAATAAAVATRCCLTAKKLQYPHTPPRSLGPNPFPCPSFSCKFFANSNRALFPPPVHLLWGIHREWLCRCICCCCCMGVWWMHQVLLLPMLFLRCCCNNSNNIIIMLRVCTSLFCPIFAKSGGGIKVFAIAPNFCKKNDKNGRISFSEVYSPFYRSSANQNEDTFSCEKNG